MSDSLPERPDLAQLGRRAKELRDAARRGDPAALERLSRHHPSPAEGKVTLAAAQLVIAREFGFPSWPRLKAAVETKLRAGRPNPAPPEEAHWRVSVFVRGVERPLALASRTEPTLEFADSDGRRLASVEADWVAGPIGTTAPYVDWSAVVAVTWSPPKTMPGNSSLLSPGQPVPVSPIDPSLWLVQVFLVGTGLALVSRTEPTLRFANGGRLASVEADWATSAGLAPPGYVDWSAVVAIISRPPHVPGPIHFSSVPPHWRVRVRLPGAELRLVSRTEPTLRFADGGRLASVEADWTTGEMGITPPAYVDWSAVVSVDWWPPREPRSHDQLPPPSAPGVQPSGGPPPLRGRPLLGNATLEELVDLIVRQRVPMVQDRPLTPPPQSIRYGDITLDLVANRVFDGDAEVNVSPREIDLLRVLILNHGHLGVLGRLAEKARGPGSPLP